MPEILATKSLVVSAVKYVRKKYIKNNYLFRFKKSWIKKDYLFFLIHLKKMFFVCVLHVILERGREIQKNA